MSKKSLILAVGAVLGLAGVITLFSSFTTVDESCVGVKKTLGSISMEELKPGFNWKKPFVESVIEVNVQLKGYTLRTDAASKDLQRISTEVTVQHSQNPDKAADSYMNIGDIEALDAKIVQPAIQESLKAVIARYTAEDLVKHRDDVKNQIGAAIRAFIEDTLEEKNIPGALVVHNVAITDFDFSPEFNKSIEEKVKAEQSALQKVNEQRKRKTEADAKYAEDTLASQAAAYEIEVVSKANANAIQREAEALKMNPALLKLRAVEKWGKGGGKLPTYVGSGQTTPFIGGGDAPVQK
jgi:regulator of protease activity HflC (stomatin/prohibitin superfamily)